MTQVGEEDVPAEPGQFGSSDGQVQLRITDILDVDGTSYFNGAEKIDLKRLIDEASDPACAVNIQVEVIGAPLRVTVSIEIDPHGTSEREEFYREYESRGQLRLPRVHWRSHGVLEPNIHNLCWNGRDRTRDRRILLAGTYKVRATARHRGAIVESVATLQVDAPRATLLGIRYQRGTWHNSASAMRTLATTMGEAGDGRRYDAYATGAIRAEGALERYAGSAIAVFDGHGNASEIYFHAREGQTYQESRASCFSVFPLIPVWMDRGSVVLPEAPRRLLDDLQLAIVLGCNTGENLTNVQYLLNIVGQTLNGVDANGVLDDATRAALDTFQHARELDRTADLDGPTIAALGITPTGVESTDVLAAQHVLRGYGEKILLTKITDQLNEPTRHALEGFQMMAGIPVTGRPDALTLDRLGVGEDDAHGRNIAEQFVRLGCDVAVGFPNASSFGVAEDWVLALFDRLLAGETLRDALDQATGSVCGGARSQFAHHIYARDGVDADALKIVPARYGAAP